MPRSGRRPPMKRAGEPTTTAPPSRPPPRVRTMPEPLRCVPPQAVIAGYDFSTGAAKALAFDLDGRVLAQARLPTVLHTEGGVSELSLAHLEAQARDATRALADGLRAAGRLADWAACGISATHHTAGRISATAAEVRRA